MQLKLKLHRDFLSSQTATLFPAVSKTRHAEGHGGLVSAADTNNDKWQRQSLTHNYSHSKQIQIIHLQSSVIFPIFLKKELFLRNCNFAQPIAVDRLLTGFSLPWDWQQRLSTESHWSFTFMSPAVVIWLRGSYKKHSNCIFYGLYGLYQFVKVKGIHWVQCNTYIHPKSSIKIKDKRK